MLNEMLPEKLLLKLCEHEIWRGVCSLTFSKGVEQTTDWKECSRAKEMQIQWTEDRGQNIKDRQIYYEERKSNQREDKNVMGVVKIQVVELFSLWAEPMGPEYD